MSKMAAGGTKRLRLVDEVNGSFHEDDLPSNKFVRVRTRTRVPVKSVKIGGGVASHSWAGGTAAASKATGSSGLLSQTRNNAGNNRTIRVARRSSEGDNHRRNYSKGKRDSGKAAANDEKGSKTPTEAAKKQIQVSPKIKSARKSPEKPKWNGRSPAFKTAMNNAKSRNGSGKGSPKKNSPKKNQVGTPVGRNKGPIPSTSYASNTPEYMKIKEDESILIEEKKERKRVRNKVFCLKTRKGQPVMRGRIELMLKEIESSCDKKDS